MAYLELMNLASNYEICQSFLAILKSLSVSEVFEAADSDNSAKARNTAGLSQMDNRGPPAAPSRRGSATPIK